MGKDKNDKSTKNNLEFNSSRDEKYGPDARYMDQLESDIKKKLRRNLNDKKK